MLDNLSHILRRLPLGDASSSSSCYGGPTRFTVHVNFDILIFKGFIDANVIDKWLNILEGYFSVHDFPTPSRTYCLYIMQKNVL